MCHEILKTLQTPISHVATMIRVSATLIPAQATDQVQIQRRIHKKSNSLNLRQTVFFYNTCTFGLVLYNLRQQIWQSLLN